MIIPHYLSVSCFRKPVLESSIFGTTLPGVPIKGGDWIAIAVKKLVKIQH